MLVQFLHDLNLIISPLVEKGSPLISLFGADLGGADLGGADLSGADLRGADLRRAYLSGADLSRADLRRAYLSGADLSEADLALAYSLKGAELPDGSLYPSASYLIPNHQEPPAH
jgi:pentapeptide repeat protein